jgi:tetratricopeptide (TPR) repeat protein
LQRFTRDMREGLRLYRGGDLDGAIRVLDRLASSGTDSFNVQYYLGRSLLEKRRFAEAIPHLKLAADSAPTRRTLSGLAAAPIYAYLVEAYAGAGRTAEALETVQKALKVAPENAELHRARGRILLEQGDLPAARTALEKARTLAPREPRLHVDLSNLYRNLADLPRARAEALEALRLQPKSPEAHVAHGLVLGAMRREREAAQAFRQALRVAPDDPDALFYLGSVELRAGRADAALPLLEKLVEKAPDYPKGRATLDLARKMAAPPAEGAMRLRLLRVADRQAAERIARRLEAGDDFAALARAESGDASAARGGDLGSVDAADLAEPLRAAAVALAPGQVSPVIETAAGYVLLKRER